MTSPAVRIWMAAIAVGVVLADSSVVILALPDMIGEFRVEVAEVAWVLTAFNAVLAVAAVPAAYLGRRHARQLFALGLLAFAVASLGCALSDSLTPLVVWRCVQAVGGAAVLGSTLEVLGAATGEEGRATRIWAAAGVVGLAIGPALGGALTELLSWQAIFAAQVPVVVAALAVVGLAVPVRTEAAGRPSLWPNVALALVSAALTAALFLVVLLLINGWLLSPLTAAATVTVMPLAAIAAGRLAASHGSPRVRATAGAVAIIGGLVALGVMPGASVWWTILPQVLVGAGLGLAVESLTEMALLDVPHPAIHAGWTVAARHLGVVVGILVLTPVFVADLSRQQERASAAVTALVLDAPIDPMAKVDLARRGVDIINSSNERIPDLAPLFASLTPRDQDRDALASLREALQDQLARAATTASSRSFLTGAGFALLALLPLAWRRRAKGES